MIYTAVIAGTIVLTMAYLTFFVDDPGSIFDTKSNTPVKEDKSELLEESTSMNDDEVRQSLIKFVDAFYRDLRKGYFDPPSYFASITDTYYNYHNLTYQRLKDAHWLRMKDLRNLDLNWTVSTLEFVRNGEQLVVTYWTHASYFKPSKNAQESGDIKNEMVINEEGKIISLREIETKNFTSYVIETAPDTLITDEPVEDNISFETDPSNASVNPEAKYEGKLYDLGTVETAPEFPGGQRELSKYISNNLKYPVSAKQNKVEGRVYVSFVVEKDGDLSGIYIIRGIGSGCDEEAMRVLRNSPAWKPGLVAGKPVRTSYTLPVNFKLIN